MIKQQVPRRMTRKQVERVLVEYDLDGKLTTFLSSLGPYAHRVVREPLPPERRRPIAALRDWVVLTRGGMLGVSSTPVYTSGDPKTRMQIGGDAVMCVFDEPDEARFYAIGVAPYSGKWNHHAFVGYCHAPKSREEMIIKLDRMWDSFRRQIARLVEVS